MKTAGIICEYNPFHNGHLYQINKTKEAGAEGIIAIMSGNFVQRGDLSIAPKSAKAQMAVDAGVDLVLELPTPWAMSCAEDFSNGAISVLKATGVCDMLSFGSESGDLEKLKIAAKAVKNSQVEEKLNVYLKDGISFAAARSKAISEVYSKEIEDIISSPNDILGVEYINAVEKTEIEPLIIKRDITHDKGSDDPFLKSASEIREMILKKDSSFKSALPFSSFEIIRQYSSFGQCPVSVNNLEQAVLAVLRKMKPEDFLNLPDVSEGLENRLYTAIMQSSSLKEVLLRAKSKRYTMARIRRIILNAYLGIEKGISKAEVPYIRVLAIGKNGKELLREMKQKATKPIITTYSDVKKENEFCQRVFEIESTCSDLYSLSFAKITPCATEKTSSIYINDKE